MFEDKAGPICVYAVPYAEPAVVRGHVASEAVRDHNSAMQALLARVRQHHTLGRRTILVAHAFVIGGEECESERPLSVGGLTRSTWLASQASTTSLSAICIGLRW